MMALFDWIWRGTKHQKADTAQKAGHDLWAAYGVMRWLLDLPRAEISVLIEDDQVVVSSSGYRLHFYPEDFGVEGLWLVAGPNGTLWEDAPECAGIYLPGVGIEGGFSLPWSDPVSLLNDAEFNRLLALRKGRA
jgi:hypothetical protein